MANPSHHQFPSSHRKTILLYHRLKEIMDNHLPVTTSVHPHDVYLAKVNNEIRVFKDVDCQEPFIENLSIGCSELESWANGKSPSNKSQQKLDDVVVRLWQVPSPRKPEDHRRINQENLNRKWVNPISSDQIGRMEFASAISFSCAKARYILDVFYQIKPSFHTFAMSSKAAKKYCQDFSGLYQLYRIEKNDYTAELGKAKGFLIKCAIVIRYPVPYRLYGSEDASPKNDTKNAATGIQRVHCKLVVPCLHNSQIFYKYDGYCMPGDEPYHELWQWLFQQRFRNQNDNRPDILHINSDGFGHKTQTNPSDCDDSAIVHGDLLTQGQGSRGKKFGYQGLSANVVIFRIPGYQCQEIHDPEMASGHSTYRALHRYNNNEWVLCDEQHDMRRYTQAFDLSNKPTDERDIQALTELATRR